MLEEQDILRGVLEFPNRGLNVSREQIGKEDDIVDSDRTRLTKVNMAPDPKKALKALYE
jgi:hypothetical protein